MATNSNVLQMNRAKNPARREAQSTSTLLLKKGTPDMWLFFITVFLVGIGVIMVFSASYYDTLSSDPFEYLKRQGAFAGIGLVIMLLAMNVNYLKYRFTAKYLLYGTFFLLAVVFFFEDIHSVHRWIPLGIINLQPSEVAKFTLSIYLADRLSKRNADPNDLPKVLGPLVLIVGLALLLIYKEPDLGAAVTLAGICVAILFSAGLSWFYIFGTALAGGGLVYLLIRSSEYQMLRIQGFLDPWSDPLNTGYQVINSYFALGSGRFWGVGIGGSRQKLGFLPEQSTDFIFSITGEELGFIGAGFIMILFLLLAWRGYLIALHCPGLYGSLLAVGITTSLVFQAALNLGVVTGALPVTGIALPFLSYGGSSLLMSMGSVGVLLNISRYHL
ncbi:MAG: putative lipid II flippase FtsW [Clostridiales bacterium]|nr:putative lipid II flippase FtsW [Clostridiales bacterium]